MSSRAWLTATTTRSAIRQQLLAIAFAPRSRSGRVSLRSGSTRSRTRLYPCGSRSQRPHTSPA
eukprot:5784535-Prymnesium_polylepis.1